MCSVFYGGMISIPHHRHFQHFDELETTCSKIIVCFFFCVCFVLFCFSLEYYHWLKLCLELLLQIIIQINKLIDYLIICDFFRFM